MVIWLLLIWTRKKGEEGRRRKEWSSFTKEEHYYFSFSFLIWRSTNWDGNKRKEQMGGDQRWKFFFKAVKRCMIWFLEPWQLKVSMATTCWGVPIPSDILVSLFFNSYFNWKVDIDRLGKACPHCYTHHLMHCIKTTLCSTFINY